MSARRKANALLIMALVATATLPATVDAGPERAPNKKPKLGAPLEKPCDVLIVDGEPAKKKRDSESFFLKTVATVIALTDNAFSVTVVENNVPARFTCKLVILANVGNLNAGAAALLEKHVEAGGGLLIFCGDRVDISTYNTHLHKKGKGLLPGKLDKVVVAAKGKADKPLRLDPATWQIGGRHPFSGDVQGQLPRHAVTGYIKATPDKLAKTELKYTNGHAAVLSKSFGKGRSMLVTTACDTEWSDLPRTTVYPVLIIEILNNFGIGLAPDLHVGEER